MTDRLPGIEAVVSDKAEAPPAGRYADALRTVIDAWGSRQSAMRDTTILKQYELIRSEVTSSMQVQQQILSFGIATIGLLAGAAFVGKQEQARSDLLTVFLPLVAYLAVTIWFSEVMRMLRAGAFLMTLERKLDKEGDGSLNWEWTVADARLRCAAGKPYFGVRDPDQLRLVAVTLLFLTLAGASVLLGWSDASTWERVFAVVAGALAVVVLFLLFRLRIAQLEDLLGVDPEVRSLRRLRRFFQLPESWQFLRRRHLA